MRPNLLSRSVLSVFSMLAFAGGLAAQTPTPTATATATATATSTPTPTATATATPTATPVAFDVAKSTNYKVGDRLSFQGRTYECIKFVALAARQYPSLDPEHWREIVWLIKGGNYTAVAGNNIQADMTAGTWTLTLPAAPAIGDAILVEDARSNCNTHNLTIARNSLKINGASSDFTMSVNGSKLRCVYINAGYGWSIK